MKIIGVICEYNPFHLGHKKQLDQIRQIYGDNCGIVCLMSGNYVQRGMPAIFDKSLRAQAALASGADLILELPITYALSSAEGFAFGGVRILSKFCDGISFGTERGNKESLLRTAQTLLSPEFSQKLREQLDKGISFPAARAAAMENDCDLLQKPNDILAVEYCKAILTLNCSMEIIPITRRGNYHDNVPDTKDPSATSIRQLIQTGSNWKQYTPLVAYGIQSEGIVHNLSAGERAVLARLRTIEDTDFEALPFGSEGLWRKFMHACRDSSTVDEIISKTKSKRYTRTRIDRMIMCAYLGITSSMMGAEPPYTRVLGFNDTGRYILKRARESALMPHTGERIDDPYQRFESRCDDLYELFATDGPQSAGITSSRRVYIHKNADC